MIASATNGLEQDYFSAQTPRSSLPGSEAG